MFLQLLPVCGVRILDVNSQVIRRPLPTFNLPWKMLYNESCHTACENNQDGHQPSTNQQTTADFRPAERMRKTKVCLSFFTTSVRRPDQLLVGG